MNQLLKRTFLPSLMAASLAGVSLFPAQPAAADDRVLGDTAVGAGAGVVTGLITGCGSVLGNAARGGAAGAAVNAANGLRSARARRNGRNYGQDALVGAGASILTGKLVGGCRNTVKNGITGLGAGTAVHIYRNNTK
ncbi:hypothetical protein I8748_23180 [Nostoc sp. CENA67]|uniref:Glycine zipper 2TM domain-containing protein n=1 Tax=Amazonocrinis nigriterrae CENA67 TaxID=2794033 RepID=A0A8J7LB91_9NOST|nr:hypothetical protein [Amazonocrinis nigriterrae]MBH8565051.1 hypothetical protein [Amazonocrinis nigriterrae CENA67]